MREIGVRELKASLSETLRAVDRGERVRVTVRGRVIADIVPPGAGGEDDLLQRLVAEGRLALPARPRPAQPPELEPASQSASALVLAERDAER
jgi:prevent-host-death family protein